MALRSHISLVSLSCWYPSIGGAVRPMNDRGFALNLIARQEKSR